MVFASDAVGVGVVIRRVELYDLVQTPFWFFWFRLRLRRLRSSEDWVVGVANKSGRTKPITKRGNVHCDWFILPLLLPTPTIGFHEIISGRGVFSGVGRNWKRSDSSDSDSVALMISLATSIFDFRWVISVLTTPRTTPTPTPTPSLVKTSLYFAHFHDIFPTEIEIPSTTALEIQHFPFKNKVVYYR